MPETADVHICFIGDSFVNGVGDPHYLGWVGRLCEKSNTPSRTITNYNLGVRGDTSLAISDRWQIESEARLSQIEDPRVVFSFGVNDTVMRSGVPRVPFRQSIEVAGDILSRAKKRYPTLMMGPPPITDPEQNERIRRIDAAFEQLCLEKRLDYLSIFQYLKNKKIWMNEVASNDGSHPAAAGYELLATYIHNWNGWWFNTDADSEA